MLRRLEKARPRLVLASSSPRRRDLLSAAGFEFEVAPPRGMESKTRDLSIAELTGLNACRKAREIAAQHPDAVVLAADTLVALGGEVIGKPADFAEAIQIIHRLRGRTHQVCTAVALSRLSRGETRAFSVITHVTFKPLDDRAVVAYLKRIDPLDKAGAYAAQGDGSEIIASISGSFTNVVGLPMDETAAALGDFGVLPTIHAARSGHDFRQETG